MKLNKLTIALALILVATIVYATATLVLSSYTVYWGDTLKITVTGASPGETCGVEIRNPNDDIVFVDEIDIGATGEGSTSWGVPPGAITGTYKVYVTCEISGELSDTFTVKKVKPVGGSIIPTLNPVPLLFLAASIVITMAVSILKKYNKLP